MIERSRSITHATFVVERTYPVVPARVFAAWADPTIKATWFGEPGQNKSDTIEFDFRVGGRELSSGKAPNGQNYSYDAHYQDIVPDQRIVYTYEMYLDDARISVSLATVELT
ncbi:MAG: SRPBCC domain-containing protein, partial [Chloroflexota bacterium]|nr:SRPBCC domain-containing protein [Chloroflexota bacterium]